MMYLVIFYTTDEPVEAKHRKVSRMPNRGVVIGTSQTTRS